MIIENNHLNKHGYFEVGDKKFYSKLDAIHHSLKIDQAVIWNYNNEVFSRQDWTTEPEQDILDLYRQRAQQIRDTFDYVVVMFSGGADSTTVLQSFVDNGILPDEIYIQHWAKGQDSGSDGFMNGEIFHAAIPYAEKTIKKFPSIRLTVFDITDHLISCLHDQSLVIDSFRSCNNIHNLAQPFVHYNLSSRFEHWTGISKQNKTICFVWGESKPNIDYDQKTNKHLIYFDDHYAHCPQPRDQEKNDPLIHHEQFFNDPSWPHLKIKQCHLILHTLRQISHRSDIFVPADENWLSAQNTRGKMDFEIAHPRSICASTVYRGQRYVLDRNAYNCSIYPKWNFLTYHQDKQANRVDHPAHYWLKEKYPEASKKWFIQFLKIYGSLPDYWTKYYGTITKGLRRLNCVYFLE